MFGLANVDDLGALPTTADIKHYWRHAPHTAADPDGLTCKAWLAGGDRAARVVLRVLLHIVGGGVPPPTFNHTMLICIPKGAEAAGAAGALRPPGHTRPLGLKNVDSKTIAGLQARQLTHAVQRAIPTHQRGFLPGRRPADNAVELDATARRLTVQHEDDPTGLVHAPSMISFDVAAAFLSIDRGAVMAALQRAGASSATLRIVAATLHMVGVFFPGGDTTSPAFEATAGVTQGCPLSPIVFTIAAEALLNMLEQAVLDLGGAHAFADDIAVLIKHLDWLAKLAAPFAAWRRATGLELQHKKTRLVPLQAEAMRASLAQTPQAHALARIQDGWQNIQLAHEFKYLGYWIGPGVTMG